MPRFQGIEGVSYGSVADRSDPPVAASPDNENVPAVSATT
jgi:hypothetical protein